MGGEQQDGDAEIVRQPGLVDPALGFGDRTVMVGAGTAAKAGKRATRSLAVGTM